MNKQTNNSINIGEEMFKLGYYYEKTWNPKICDFNYNLMKEHYLIAIINNNSDAMYRLGLYYKNIYYNYDLMKKYYLMSINNGNINTMYKLGLYYEKEEINYELMKKYYLMAIKEGNLKAKKRLDNFIPMDAIF